MRGCKCRCCTASNFPTLIAQKIDLQAYWPFHKSVCKRNEFADALEESEPRFARWMRKHGKIAAIKDDEVDRIERASHAACGPSREEVMKSMYNRLSPKPIGKNLTGSHVYGYTCSHSSVISIPARWAWHKKVRAAAAWWPPQLPSPVGRCLGLSDSSGINDGIHSNLWL